MLECRGQSLAFALDGSPRIGVEVRVGEPRGEPDHDQHDQDFRQREPGCAASCAIAARLQVPRADVGVESRAARRTVCAEAEHVDTLRAARD